MKAGLKKNMPSADRMGNLNMNKGGMMKKGADGIAKKGKTNCKMPKMAKGGKAAKGCK